MYTETNVRKVTNSIFKDTVSQPCFPESSPLQYIFSRKGRLREKTFKESQNHPPPTPLLPTVTSSDESAQLISKSCFISQRDKHDSSMESCHICYSIVLLPFSKLKHNENIV